jgi:phosphohistidine phosphatase
MPRLFLLRHAKAAWAAPGMSDRDRPLTPEGMRAARLAGAAIAADGGFPELVLCSPALRTRQTHECLSAAAGQRADVRFVDALYDTGAGEYMEVLRGAGSVGTVMIVGHNPSMEDFADALAGGGDARALASLKRGFPVCGMATLAFDGPFPAVLRGSGTLEAFRVFEG